MRFQGQRSWKAFVSAISASLFAGSCAGLIAEQTKSGHSREALSAAIAPDFVTAAIIGVSTRQHLNELLSSIA